MSEFISIPVLRVSHLSARLSPISFCSKTACMVSLVGVDGQNLRERQSEGRVWLMSFIVVSYVLPFFLVL